MISTNDSQANCFLSFRISGASLNGLPLGYMGFHAIALFSINWSNLRTIS